MAFDRRWRTALPYLAGGLLICPGRLDGTWQGHRCRFVSLDGIWCWEHPGAVADEVRSNVGPGRHLQTVTAVDADAVDLIESVKSRCDWATHRLVETTALRIAGRQLEVDPQMCRTRIDARRLDAAEARRTTCGR